MESELYINQSVSSTANCLLKCTLSTRVQLSADLYTTSSRWSMPAISNAECLLGCSLAAQLQFVSSAQFQVFKSILSSRAVCHLSCKSSTQLSAQLQSINSAVSSAATCQLSCQLRCETSAQLQSVSRVDLLLRLNSILPPKLWAAFLAAINHSRVHAVTVH